MNPIRTCFINPWLSLRIVGHGVVSSKNPKFTYLTNVILICTLHMKFNFCNPNWFHQFVYLWFESTPSLFIFNFWDFFVFLNHGSMYLICFCYKDRPIFWITIFIIICCFNHICMEKYWFCEFVNCLKCLANKSAVLCCIWWFSSMNRSFSIIDRWWARNIKELVIYTLC